MNQTRKPAFNQPTTHSVSARIRQLRRSRSLTLKDVENLSNGSIKAVVMGSYERGARAISLARTIEIANLFGIPLSELLQAPIDTDQIANERYIFDLKKVDTTALENNSLIGQATKRFLDSLAVRRSDWNSEVLSVRATDIESLSVVLGIYSTDLARVLREGKLLLN